MANRFIAMCVALLLWALPAIAADGQFEKLTISDTPSGFTATTIRPTSGPPMLACAGKVESAPIRYRYDGGTPNSSTGVLADVGEWVTVPSLEALDSFLAVRTSITNGTINFVCSRYMIAVQSGSSSSGGTTLTFGTGEIDGGVQRVNVAVDDPVSESAVILAGAVSANKVQAAIASFPAGPATGKALTFTNDNSSSVEFLAANVNRRAAKCRNTSTVNAYVTATVAATILAGEMVAPGGHWVEDDGALTAFNAIWGTSAGASDPNTGGFACQEKE